ncbi:hypothetical protein, partial [Sphingobacterium athyrii]|uniref:hypothetical protein n=1 Tax=Sphingobacterium athyrii TaxID=2152717 RepID=UPI0028B183C3
PILCFRPMFSMKKCRAWKSGETGQEQEAWKPASLTLLQRTELRSGSITGLEYIWLLGMPVRLKITRR